MEPSSRQRRINRYPRRWGDEVGGGVPLEGLRLGLSQSVGGVWYDFRPIGFPLRQTRKPKTCT